MKNIKVYLQYPWKRSDSQYYKSLIENPPEDIEYISEEKTGMITNKNLFRLRSFLKKIIRSFLVSVDISIVNKRSPPVDNDYDLIHCAHCLSYGDKPWVADFEDVWQMSISGNLSKSGKESVSKLLLGKQCKKIIAWTEFSKKRMVDVFPKIEDKIDIVPYATHVPKFKKIKSEKITLLFIGRYFYGKGGLHTLEVFDNLVKKHPNVEAIFISTVPSSIKEKYSKNDKLKIYDLMPHGKIISEVFPKCDIFVYPGYSDSFGFAFVEALSFGLPVVTVDGTARREIIRDGETGFVIDRPSKVDIKSLDQKIIKKIIDKTEVLINDAKLRNRMSKCCIGEVKNGKFSIENRNKKLKKIYGEAIR